MQTLHLIADNNDEGIRLDAFLAQKSGETRSRIQNLIKDGCVRRNGKAPGKAGEKLTAGDEIELTLPDPEPLEAVPVEMDIPIVYEDADIVVVNKPRALVVHPAAGHQQDTLVNALLFACDDLSGIGGKMRPGIVHRLDKDLLWEESPLLSAKSPMTSSDPFSAKTSRNQACIFRRRAWKTNARPPDAWLLSALMPNAR